MSTPSKLRDQIVNGLTASQFKQSCDDFSDHHPHVKFNYERDIPSKLEYGMAVHETLRQLQRLNQFTAFENFLYAQWPHLRDKSGTTGRIELPLPTPNPAWVWPGLTAVLLLTLLFVLWSQSTAGDPPVTPPPTATFTATQEALFATATQLALVLPTQPVPTLTEPATFTPAPAAPTPAASLPTITPTSPPTIPVIPSVPPIGTLPPATSKPSTPTVTPTPGAGTQRAFPLPNGETVTMVFIPAGPFLMGSEEGGDNEKPVHEVFVDSFWIDLTEVTNEQFALFVADTGYVTTAEEANDYHTWLVPSWLSNSIEGKYQEPVVNISWHDAVAFCKWRKAELPNEAEWEKAARWNFVIHEAYIYPWGNTFQIDLANCADNCQDSFESTSIVGSFSPAGDSPYGVQDMAGNVWEWTSSWYEAYPGNGISNNSYGKKYKVIRGGGWYNFYDEDLVSFNRLNISPETRSFSIGFRCVSTPD